MRIISPSVENITPSSYDLESIYKHIELCGRTCYKSEDKITKDSYKKFCELIKNNKHLSCYEHGTVYLDICKFQKNINFKDINIYSKYINNPYSKVIECKKGILPVDIREYIITNLRVIIENGWEEDLKYLCEPTEYHEKRYTFKVVCDRAMLAEITRHRRFSFSAESQRYCAYNKSKFGGEVTFVKPHWFESNISNERSDNLWYNAMLDAECKYLCLLDEGIKPQDARTVLPNSCKTEIVVTGFKSDWKHFLSLRSSKAGATGMHPDMNTIANKIYDNMQV